MKSFASKAWSCDTLIRGLDLLEEGSNRAMSEMPDPDPEAMQAELERLEAPQLNQAKVATVVGWFWWYILWYFCFPVEYSIIYKKHFSGIGSQIAALVGFSTCLGPWTKHDKTDTHGPLEKVLYPTCMAWLNSMASPGTWKANEGSTRSSSRRQLGNDGTWSKRVRVVAPLTWLHQPTKKVISY